MLLLSWPFAPRAPRLVTGALAETSIGPRPATVLGTKLSATERAAGVRPQPWVSRCRRRSYSIVLGLFVIPGTCLPYTACSGMLQWYAHRCSPFPSAERRRALAADNSRAERQFLHRRTTSCHSCGSLGGGERRTWTRPTSTRRNDDVILPPAAFGPPSPSVFLARPVFLIASRPAVLIMECRHARRQPRPGGHVGCKWGERPGWGGREGRGGATHGGLGACLPWVDRLPSRLGSRFPGNVWAPWAPSPLGLASLVNSCGSPQVPGCTNGAGVPGSQAPTISQIDDVLRTTGHDNRSPRSCW